MPLASITSVQLLDQGLRARTLDGASLADLVSTSAFAVTPGTTPAASAVDALGVLNDLLSGPAVSRLDSALIGLVRGFRTPLEAATWFIQGRYSALGGPAGVLGAPRGALTAIAGTVGFQAEYEHGLIAWHPAVGAHALHGPIRARWLQLGGATGWLGFPSSDVTPGRDAGAEGSFAHFQGGSIYWAPPPPRIDVGPPQRVSELASSARAALAVAAQPSPALAATALASGRLDPASRPDLAGRTATLAELAGNTVLVTPPVAESSAGAFEVHGAIREKYLALGAEASILGYPRTDETGTPDGIGRFNHFERGSIYWTPATGAHEVHGLIRDHWAANGWERNPQLGYPISDELIPDRRIGHRRPETRTKPVAGVPRDVTKLPAEAASAGFPPSVLAAALPSVRVAAGAASGSVLAAGVGALGRLSDKTLAQAVTADRVTAVDRPGREVLPGAIDVGERITPTPASTEAEPRSVNRFSDFESGVLFWTRGTTTVTALAPLAKTADGTALSFSGADIARVAWSRLGAATFSAANQTPGTLSFVGVTGYSHDGAQVHNRRHRLQLIVQGVENHGAGPFNLPFPVTAVVELHVEVWFDPAQRRLALALADWSLSQASSGSYGAAVNASLHTRLDPLVWSTFELVVLPDTNAGAPIAVLAVKTLSNGVVAVYVEPPANGLGAGVLESLATLAVAPSVVHLVQPR